MTPKATTSTAAVAKERPFIITRTFDAPRALVWKAWTERERLARWWGPKGFVVEVLRLDLRPGGIFHYGLRSANGQQHWGRFVYREIAAPERLVFVVTFADKDCNVVRHPWDANWPLEMLSTVTFVERAGKTAVTVTWVPLNATDVEERTFYAGRESMRAGWTGTCDQLERYLAKP